MDVNVNSLYQEMQSMVSEASQNANTMPRQELNTSASEFSELLNQALDNVNGLQLESKGIQQRFDLGDPNISLAEVMIAKEKSGIAFEATVQVRNKLLEAYKTIMNMPV